MSAAGASTVRIVDVYPDLLGTYGDGGNAVVLAQRLRWRGYRAEVARVAATDGEPVPSQADLYCLGGGEDGPQSQAAVALIQGRSLSRALEGGAAVLAVCAGFQIVGEVFAGADGSLRPGVELLPVRSRRGTGRRAVGELVALPGPGSGLPPASPLTGYENHGGVTELGPGVEPLGRAVVGVGNGAGGGAEGALWGRVVGTYLHGPVLARNPALADRLLTLVVGDLPPLDQGEADGEVAELRAERLAAAGCTGVGGRVLGSRGRFRPGRFPRLGRVRSR